MNKYKVKLTKDPQKQETTLTVTFGNKEILSDTLYSGKDFYLDTVSTFFYLYNEDADKNDDWVTELKSIHPVRVDISNNEGLEFQYHLREWFLDNSIELPPIVESVNNLSSYFKIHEEGLLQKALGNLYDDIEMGDFEIIEEYIELLTVDIKELVQKFNKDIENLFNYSK